MFPETLRGWKWPITLHSPTSPIGVKRWGWSLTTCVHYTSMWLKNSVPLRCRLLHQQTAAALPGVWRKISVRYSSQSRWSCLKQYCSEILIKFSIYKSNFHACNFVDPVLYSLYCTNMSAVCSFQLKDTIFVSVQNVHCIKCCFSCGEIKFVRVWK